MSSPVMVGGFLSPTFIPALQKVVSILRRKYPKECDGDLIGRVLLTGVCQIIDCTPPGDTALVITGCSDPQKWYANKIGAKVPFMGISREAYISRDADGYFNNVEFADADLVEAPTC